MHTDETRRVCDTDAEVLPHPQVCTPYRTYIIRLGTGGSYVPFLYPMPSDADRATLAVLAQKCLDAKGVACEAWEKEINERVEALYGL